MDASTEASTNGNGNSTHAPAGGTDPAAEQSHGLAADLQRLEAAANGMPITIGRVVDLLSERGNAVAIVLLAAPFIMIPVPGVSTAFGIVMMGLSLGVLFSSKPPLPAFVRRREISPSLLSKIIGGATWILNKVQRFVRPRMKTITDRRLHWLTGLSLIVCTILFALPIPIPLNNSPPAIGLVLLALGLAERDGLLVLIGHIYTLILCIILVVCAFLFWEAVSGYISSKF